MAYLKDFRERILQNDYPGFLKIWEEYCYGDQPDGPEMIAVLESVKKSEFASHFGLQVERIFPLWRCLTDAHLAHAVLRLVLDIQTTNSEELADLAISHLKLAFPEDPLFLEKLRLVGLRNRENFQGAIRNFELLTHMKKGNYVFHTAGWGTGEITDASLVREEISIEFENVLGTQTLSFEKSFKTLLVLEKNHFYARRFGEPDKLEAEAKENPTEVIRLLLKDLGPKNAAEIKEEMFDLVIPEEEWNRWWQTARAKLKKDTKIQSPKEIKEPFVLREEELPHEVTFHKLLEAKPAIHAMIHMFYTFLRDFPETLKNGEFKLSLQEKLKEALNSEHLAETQKIQLLLLLEDLDGQGASALLEKEILKAEEITKVIENIDIAIFQKRCLQIVIKHKKEWLDICSHLLFSVTQNNIRDFLVTEMNCAAGKEILKKKILSLLLHPTMHPEIFVWYFHKIIDPKSKLPFADQAGKNQFFEGLFILLDHLEQKPAQRDLVKKILQTLTEDRYAIVREILKHSSLEEVKEYLLLATKCSSFTDHDIKIFQSLGEVVHPSLTKFRKDKPKEDVENILWTTKEGYQKTQLRIQEIATIETVMNAKEIETARALGDLRENAEFKAALEKRSRLQSELQFLSEQLNKARVLTKEDVLTEEVSAGSVVECLDSKGEHLSFTLLGPWDADPEKKILSFQSKFAQAMKGLSVGEKFEFQGEHFTITDLRNYFDGR